MIQEKIENICVVVRGSSPRPQGDPRYYGGQVPRLMVSDVTRDGMYVTPKIDFLTEAGAKLSRPMLKGDLVVAVSGDPGEPSILNVDACIHDGFVGLRNLNAKLVYTPYLYRYFKFNKLRSKSQAVGAIYKNLNTDQIKNLVVPLPPLTEQKKIAALLDAADSLRQKDKALVAKYDELTQSLFLEMFGDPVRNEKGWETDYLSNQITLVGGGTPSKENEAFWNGTIPWASVKDIKGDWLDSTTDHITQEGVDNSATRVLPAGTIVIATRMAVGKVLITRIDAAINQDLKGIKIKTELNKFFLFHSLKMCKEYFEGVSSGATVQGIKIEHITNLKLIIPPLKLQNQFAERVQAIEKQKSLAQVGLKKSEELFEGLLGRVFK